MPNLRRTRLNAFWMFLLFVVVSQALDFALEEGLARTPLVNVNDRTWRPSIFIWFELVSFVAVIGASLFVCWLQRRRLREVGFAGDGALRQALWGALWGLVAPTALIGMIAAFGGFTFGSLAMSGQKLAIYAIGWLAAFTLLGAAEEATFRGAAQFTLGEAIGPWPAAIAISAIFGAIHYFLKPGENLADAASVTLLGLFMAFTVIRSGSIWYAVGFHALFDYAAMYLYGAPNSGNNDGASIPTRLLTGGYHGPAWLTGAKLGIEASWLVFPVIAALFVGYHFATRKAASSPATLGYNPPHPV
jgi:membrane protease YdiL (CAAX protease family)